MPVLTKEIEEEAKRRGIIFTTRFVGDRSVRILDLKSVKVKSSAQGTEATHMHLSFVLDRNASGDFVRPAMSKVFVTNHGAIPNEYLAVQKQGDLRVVRPPPRRLCVACAKRVWCSCRACRVSMAPPSNKSPPWRRASRWSSSSPPRSRLAATS